MVVAVVSTELAEEEYWALSTNGWVKVPPRCESCGERWQDGDNSTWYGDVQAMKHDQCPVPERWKQIRERAAIMRYLHVDWDITVGSTDK